MAVCLMRGGFCDCDITKGYHLVIFLSREYTRSRSGSHSFFHGGSQPVVDGNAGRSTARYFMLGEQAEASLRLSCFLSRVMVTSLHVAACLHVQGTVGEQLKARFLTLLDTSMSRRERRPHTTQPPGTQEVFSMRRRGGRTGSPYAERKDYAAEYQAAVQADWLSDLSMLWYPFRNAVLTAFREGDTVAKDIETAGEQFAAALFEYVQRGVQIDMTEYLQSDSVQNGECPVPLVMSAADNPEKEAAPSAPRTLAPRTQQITTREPAVWKASATPPRHAMESRVRRSRP